MITILLVIIILALIGHVLENTNPVEECSFDFSDTRKQFKSKEKSSLSGEGCKEYYGKATLESLRKTKKILEESENNKIGDNNV